MMKNPPLHLKEASEFEPLYPPQEFILEETLRREAERINADALLGRVVYDAVNLSSYWPDGVAPQAREGEQPPYYLMISDSDTTLEFESRFESGNLRRAI